MAESFIYPGTRSKGMLCTSCNEPTLVCVPYYMVDREGVKPASTYVVCNQCGKKCGTTPGGGDHA